MPRWVIEAKAWMSAKTTETRIAAILFGTLYQGGAELAFDMPAISRDMIVVIQGLVILFAGALEHMFRPGLSRAFALMSTTQRRRMVDVKDRA